MTVTIAPFTEEHVADAAVLLAARHRRDRGARPVLDATYDDPATLRPILADLLAADGASGVTALRDDRVVDYLLGAPALDAPTRPFAALIQPRAAMMPTAGHAVDPVDAAALYPRLYAAVAERWVRDGLIAHYLAAPADPDLLAIWSALGFSPFTALGVRATSPDGLPDASEGGPLQFRRATLEDASAVDDVLMEMFRAFAEPPSFLPFLPETARERRHFVDEHLADPACPCWLAVADERVVAVQLFEEPQSPCWHHTPRHDFLAAGGTHRWPTAPPDHLIAQAGGSVKSGACPAVSLRRRRGR